MTVIAWIVEGTWPACVDAASTHAPEGAGIVLLHVTGDDVPGAAHGAYAGLFGRGRPDRDPGTRLQQLAAAVRSATPRGPPPSAWAGPAPGWNDPGGSSGKSSPSPTAPIFSSSPATATAPTWDPAA